MAFWNELPVVGGLLGGIFGNPEEEAHQKALHKAQQEMYQYRPELMQVRMNTMGQMSHAFEPMNNLMAQAYGPQAQFDIQSMVKNPFSQDAQDRMYQQAHPPKAAPSRMGMQPVGPDGRTPMSQWPQQQPVKQYNGG